MSIKDYPMQLIIKAIDKATGPIRGITASIERMSKPAARLNQQFAAMTGSLQTAMTRIGAATAVAGFGFKKLFLDPAVEAERFKNVLETLEGSTAKAAASFKWIESFAKTTPYQLADVTGAFVKLKAYGLDPTNGLLKTLGDTSAAMGKPLEMSIEAIADAVTGENERLKEFGIKARKEGAMITYEYTANGKTMTKSAQANSRAQIQATLQAIWNEKYKGAMDKQSRSFEGQLSNMLDAWTSFARTVMTKGPLEFLTKMLARVNAMVEKLAANGTLEKWATQTGKAITDAFKSVAEIVPKVWSVMQTGYGVLKQLGTYVGGTANAVAILAGAYAFGGLITSIIGATAAFASFSAVLLTTPLGATIALIGALAVGVYSIYDNWSGIVDWWSKLWDSIKISFEQWWRDLVKFVERMDTLIGNALFSALTGAFEIARRAVPQWFLDLTGGAFQLGVDIGSGLTKEIGNWFGPEAPAAAARPVVANRRAQQDPRLSGHVDVRVHIPNAPPGTRATARQSGFTEFRLDTGYAMGDAR